MRHDDGPQDQLSGRELEILLELDQGASDREIARKLHLSLNTVKWHNRQIYAKLNVANRDEAVEVADRLGLLGAEAERRAMERPVPSNLPPLDLTSFVGRERDLTALSELLASQRLITLTGPGGVGKSRLGLHTAAANRDRFEHGVFLVELTPVREPEFVPKAIADALGLSERGDEPLSDLLARHLDARRMLLLLDGFEHLIAAAPIVKELQEAAREVSVLTTSRERLNLYGEQVYPVEPLARSDSVELFYQRARELDPGFDASQELIGPIEGICERVDDLPLAIELAASRVPILPPQAILDRLTPSLEGLRASEQDRPDRHQTLRATIDWSYQLLDEDEKRFFTSLSAFVAGATLDAVEAVCAPDLSSDLLDLLVGLINKSLLQSDAGVEGEPRFTMLETIRTWAEQHIEEDDPIRTRLAEYWISLSADTRERFRGTDETARRTIDSTKQEMPNLRAAFHWLMETNDIGGALDLLLNLRDFFWASSLMEGTRWTDRWLSKAQDAPTTKYAQAMTVAGEMAYIGGDLKEAGERAAGAVESLRDTGEAWALADALRLLGSVHSQEGRYDQGEIAQNEALALYEQLDDRFEVAYVLNSLGELMRMQGEFVRAGELYEKSLRLRTETHYDWGGAAVLLNLAAVARHLNHHNKARSYLMKSLDVSWARQVLPMLCGAVEGLAGLLIELDAERSVRWMGAAAAVREEAGYELEPVDRVLYDRDLETLRELLSEREFVAAWEEGKSMGLEQAVEQILNAEADPLGSDPTLE